jgi:hypothetical protein
MGQIALNKKLSFKLTTIVDIEPMSFPVTNICKSPINNKPLCLRVTIVI